MFLFLQYYQVLILELQYQVLLYLITPDKTRIGKRQLESYTVLVTIAVDGVWKRSFCRCCPPRCCRYQVLYLVPGTTTNFNIGNFFNNSATASRLPCTLVGSGTWYRYQRAQVESCAPPSSTGCLLLVPGTYSTWYHLRVCYCTTLLVLVANSLFLADSSTGSTVP